MTRNGDIPGGGEVKPPKPKPKGKSTSKERAKPPLAVAEVPSSQAEPMLREHAVLCQTTLPYHDPGEGVRSWERRNGGIYLSVCAGDAVHPERGRWVELGLPHGPECRLILAHLNAEALRRGTPLIEVGASLPGFVQRLGLDPQGQDADTLKDQLARLAASRTMLGLLTGGRALTIYSQVVSAFVLRYHEGDQRRVLWPSLVRLSAEYFDSLTQHAVPLDERSLAALSGSAMALDVYAWLAQRLHRIEWGQSVLVPWAALKAQFGWHHEHMEPFEAEFRQSLRDVHAQYRAAKLDLDGHGMTLRNSPPPAKGRIGIVVRVP